MRLNRRRFLKVASAGIIALTSVSIELPEGVTKWAADLTDATDPHDLLGSGHGNQFHRSNQRAIPPTSIVGRVW